MHPTNPAIVYAIGYFDRDLYQTVDSGDTWDRIGTDLPADQNLTQLVIDPQSPATLYAILNAEGAVYKSADGGTTWDLANTGLGTKVPNSIAIDPQQPATLFLQAGGDLFRSTNAAGSWQLAETGMEFVTAQVIAVDPTASARVYAGVSREGVYKSSNGGDIWSRSGSGIYEADTYEVVFGPQRSPTLYAAGDNGLFTSADQGTTWDLVNSASFFSQFAVNPLDPAVLYTGDSTGLRKSVDGGVDWDIVLGPYCDFVFCYHTPISDLALDPLNSSNIYASYANNRRAGVYRSTTAGSDWDKVTTGLTDPGVLELAIDPATPATLYAGTQSGVFKSTDSAENWASANTGIPATADISRLEVAPGAPQTLYAGTGSQLYRSTNGATSWQELTLPQGATSVGTILIDPSRADTLYVAFSNGIHHSADGGASWARLGDGLAGRSIYRMVLHPTNPNQLYAGVASGSVQVYEIVAPPTITAQPAARTVVAGQTAALSVAATDTGGLSYQWYVGASGDTSSPVAGATGSSFTTPALSANTRYWVRVTNERGASADSLAVTISVVSTLDVALPSSATAGSSVPALVTARDSAGALATGYRGTVRFSSSDAQATLPADYTFTAADNGAHSFPITFGSQGSQTLSVSDTVGIGVSDSASLNVLTGAPQILSQPAGLTVITGQQATLSVTASGAGSLSYRWYSGSSGDTSAPIAGAAGAGATLTTPALSANARYWVRISGVTGPGVDSDTATVAVVTAIDLTAPASAAAGAGLNVTVTARDSSGAIARGYRGTVRFSSSDAQASLPADYTFTAADNGAHSFPITFGTQGARTLTVRNLTATELSRSTTVTVGPGSGPGQHVIYLPLLRR